ncbi:MAG: hypothetical protein ACOVKJ_02230 [Flavobacterium sp.]
MEESLSDSQIKDYFHGKVPVMLYTELCAKPLRYTLNTETKSVIFLLRDSKDYGHWCAIFLKNAGKEQGIHIFDSYGNYPDCNQWKHKEDKMLEQYGNLLCKRLYDENVPVYFNHHVYQNNSPIIATCGRHCIMRILKKNLATEEYYNFMNSLGHDYDQSVSREIRT